MLRPHNSKRRRPTRQRVAPGLPHQIAQTPLGHIVVHAARPVFPERIPRHGRRSGLARPRGFEHGLPRPRRPLLYVAPVGSGGPVGFSPLASGVETLGSTFLEEAVDVSRHRHIRRPPPFVSVAPDGVAHVAETSRVGRGGEFQLVGKVDKVRRGKAQTGRGRHDEIIRICERFEIESVSFDRIRDAELRFGRVKARLHVLPDMLGIHEGIVLAERPVHDRHPM
mmetsp:Transcript_8271/g.17993  ORF Transcript_8271/g.17993 Transcript_8271/m.17993 type:complete len:224 (+) Transcript_8271:234-905(+)